MRHIGHHQADLSDASGLQIRIRLQEPLHFRAHLVKSGITRRSHDYLHGVPVAIDIIHADVLFQSLLGGGEVGDHLDVSLAESIRIRCARELEFEVATHVSSPLIRDVDVLDDEGSVQTSHQCIKSILANPCRFVQEQVGEKFCPSLASGHSRDGLQVRAVGVQQRPQRRTPVLKWLGAQQRHRRLRHQDHLAIATCVVKLRQAPDLLHQARRGVEFAQAAQCCQDHCTARAELAMGKSQ
mmetsp:Transcript_43894/g.104564  ORF Transcript_43894/g.104564 Transcript_43894/m.104564 type:complete len:240 (+) Transcript_43894:3167-3886(+)